MWQNERKTITVNYHIKTDKLLKYGQNNEINTFGTHQRKPRFLRFAAKHPMEKQFT